MKNILYLVLALILAWIIWGFIKSIVGVLITIGMIVLFCSLVYWIYKTMTREKIV